MLSYKEILKIVTGVMAVLTFAYLIIQIARIYRRKNPNRLPTRRARINALKTKASKDEIRQWYRMAIEKIVTARLQAECSLISGEPIFLSHYISKGRLRHWVLHVYGYKYELRQESAKGCSIRKHYKAFISLSGFNLQEYQRTVTANYLPIFGKYFYSIIGWTSLSKEEVDQKCDEVEKSFGRYALLTNNCHDFLQTLADTIVTKKAPDWEWFREHDVTGYQYSDQPALRYNTIYAAMWSNYLTRSRHYLSVDEREKIDDLIATLENIVDADVGREILMGLQSAVMTLKLFNHVVDFQEHNNNVIQRNVLPRTESRYTDKLNLFDIFLKLHPQAISPPDIQTCRAFMEWIGRGTYGRIEERPTVETMLGFFREFATSLKRQRSIELPSSTRITINEFVLGELKRKIGLSTKSMDKDGGVSPNDLTILMTQLWCRDHHEYRGSPPDRARVQLSAAMLLYCFTTARTGEVHESTARRHKAYQIGNNNDGDLEARVMAACYKHFILTVEIVDGTVMLVLTYEREFVKGFWRKRKWSIPTHAFYEVYVEDVSIFLNLLTFFLPMATADQAFQKYSSVIEILNAVEEHGKADHSGSKILEVIDVRENMKEVPVFRQYLEHDITQCKGNARGADSFGKSLVSLGHRSGYSLNITVRACRRWALQEADKNHSESARMKFAGHINRDTYGKAYAHPLSEIDGPANYLGIASRQDHILNRRGMGLYHNNSSPQLLPAKAEFEFLARDDISHLDHLLAKLNAQLLTTDPEEKRRIQLEQKRINRQKRFLYNDELRKIQRRSEGQHGSIFTENLFHYRKRVMPEREFLAATLPSKITLRSSNGKRALQALESLCSETGRISYRDSLSPINDSCLCGKRYKTTEDGYISIAATQDTTDWNISLRKCALSVINGLNAKGIGKSTAKIIWIMRRNSSAVIL
ncbi:zinc finger protein [Penicillium herquei]|nr:zinc finger protein [Penicillium herquei]